MAKVIGMVGGLSPESTIYYYKYITEEYYRRFGNYSYPEIVIYSVNFQKFVNWMNAERWDLIADELVRVLTKLYYAGADFGILTSNTVHAVFDEVQKRSPIPLISIIDATIEEIKKAGIDTVGLLGTLFTMTKDFFRRKLEENGISVILPSKEDMEYVNDAIFKELVAGIFLSKTKQEFIRIINDMKERGAKGIILGCTEIPLLVSENDVNIKLFDTTRIHAKKALSYALTD
ncbi:MAG TPA: aspartate/glutamate racemase family protein [Euryarchaeota archaeon]|nr:aspartate/glutamate racemase family protein [Euryarchaeota archaeon]